MDKRAAAIINADAQRQIFEDRGEQQAKVALADILRAPAADSIRPIKYEGDAAAAYILDEKVKAQGTRGAVNIILDIGGGTRVRTSVVAARDARGFLTF